MRASQHGIALLTALVIVALVTSAAVAMAARQLVEIRRTGNLLDYDRAVELIGDLETEAQAVLARDGELAATDSLDEPWATDAVNAARPGASGSARLRDLQARFNINNLVLLPGSGTALGSSAASGQRARARAPAPTAPATSGAAGEPAARAAQMRSQLPSARAPVDAAGDARTDLPVGAAGEGTFADEPAAIDPAAWDVPDFLLGDEFERERQEKNRILLRELARLYGFGTPAAAEPPAGRDGNDTGRAGARAGAAAGTATPSSAGGQPGAVAAGRLPGTPSSDTPAAADAAGDADPTRALKIAQLRFILLLRALDLDPAIAQAVLDWLDPDSETRFPDGAEDEYYTELDPPYRAANAPIASTRELLLVRGVTEQIHARLAPFITALPMRTDINVNTAPAELLMSLGPMLDAATVEALVAAREVQPFASAAELTAHPLLAGRPIPADELTPASRWFELRARVRGGRLAITARSLVARPRPTLAHTVRRSTGYLDEY